MMKNLYQIQVKGTKKFEPSAYKIGLILTETPPNAKAVSVKATET